MQKPANTSRVPRSRAKLRFKAAQHPQMCQAHVVMEWNRHLGSGLAGLFQIPMAVINLGRAYVCLANQSVIGTKAVALLDNNLEFYPKLHLILKTSSRMRALPWRRRFQSSLWAEGLSACSSGFSGTSWQRYSTRLMPSHQNESLVLRSIHAAAEYSRTEKLLLNTKSSCKCSGF